MSRGFTKEERIAAFWAKVDKKGSYPSKVAIESFPEIKGTRCWEWIASKDKCGYGYFGVGNGGILKAHRFSYGLVHKDLSDDVLHKCDNPSCVRELHLYEGTVQDNMRDRNKKMRQSRGIKHSKACRTYQPDRSCEKNSNSKLTKAKVRAIRRLSKKYFNTHLALMFNTTPANIGYILKRKTWAHV